MPKLLAAATRMAYSGMSAVYSRAVSYGPQLTNGASRVANWGAQNPIPATTGAIGCLGMAVPALFSGPVLAALGFSTTGVGAGSAAAAIQGTIGSVAPGSLFAIAQSAGAGGAGIAIVNGIIQGGGVVMTAGSAALAFMKSKL